MLELSEASPCIKCEINKVNKEVDIATNLNSKKQFQFIYSVVAFAHVRSTVFDSFWTNLFQQQSQIIH